MKSRIENDDVLEWLKQKTGVNSSQGIRLCLHTCVNDNLHKMLNVHRKKMFACRLINIQGRVNRSILSRDSCKLLWREKNAYL